MPMKQIWLAVGLICFPGCQKQIDVAEHPNIVILFADDLGYGDLSCYGHPTIRTPNLDRLAETGIRLTSFYAAAPVCTPSRAALLTGRYPLRSTLPQVLGPNSEHGLPENEITLAEALKDVGYRTMCIGKWHLGSTKPSYLPTANGFDSYFGLLYSNDMIPPWVQTSVPLRLYRDTTAVEDPGDQSTLTKRYTEEAIKFIKSAKDAPFFLYLPYSMPHLPINTAPEFRGKSRAGLYGDVIETIDWSAGEIIRTLKQAGLDRETIVVFCSDNGPWINLPDRMLQQGVQPWHVGTKNLLRGAKAATYEGGMRVPAIISWPGQIPERQTSADIATTMDLYTTLIKAAHAEVPSDRVVDGLDVMPFLKGETASPREVFYYFHVDKLQAVREGKWKLRIAGYRRIDNSSEMSETPELYDLDIDPAERINVAASNPDVVARLRVQMEKMATEIGASIEN